MKKIFVRMIALLTGIGLAIAGTGLADEVELGGYSEEELFTLYKRIAQEMTDRGVQKTAHLLAGTFFAGRDIPAGTYLLIVDNSESDHYAVVEWKHAWLDENGKQTGEYYPCTVPAGQKAQYQVTLSEGESIKIGAPSDLTMNGVGVLFE